MYSSTKSVIQEDDGGIIASLFDHVLTKPEESVRTVYSPDGKIAVYAGLVRDDDCESPLESSDGEGAIYFAGRRGDRESQHRYQEALGLDSDYRRNTNLGVVESMAEDMLRKRLYPEANTAVCMEMEAARYGVTVNQLRTDILNEIQGYRCSWVEFSDEDKAIFAEFDWEKLLEEAWHACRQAGTIGDMLAVLLDVYEHSGMVLSVSGTGYQCAWDTTTGGALWVPDDVARDEILKRRAPVYTKGRVVDNRKTRSNRRYTVETLGLGKEGMTFYADVKHPSFEHWHEAFDFLQQLEVEVTRSIEAAQEAAAREYAHQVLESYNSWLAGDCWGFICYAIDLKTQTIVEKDSCWGFVGQEWAEEALDDAIASALNLPPVQ